MRASACWVTCIALLAASSSLAADEPAATAPSFAPRFALRAQIEAQPPAQTDARFTLRGTLQPARPIRALDAGGLVLSAVLQPKAGELCFGPGHIFADGFETPP